MKAPWHLWVIGIVALLWNGLGAFDYVMTIIRHDGYMSQFTPDQLAYYDSFPGWAMFCWALAVWMSVLGSLLLLLRSGHAALAFAMSLFGMAGTTIYSFVLSDTKYLDLVGPVGLWFTLAIVVVAIGLYLYARRMRQTSVIV